MSQNNSTNIACISKDVESFFNELLSIESRRQVLVGRVGGETIREIAQRLNVTDERVRQIEAKITRKFAISQTGRRIVSALSDINTTEELKMHCGIYYAEVIYLLRLYKDSFFYNGEQIDKFAL